MRLLGKTLDELREIAKSLGMPAFTGGQMAKWIYEKRVANIDGMTNISKQNREKLKAAGYEVGHIPHVDAQYSKDGTIKYLFPVEEADVYRAPEIKNRDSEIENRNSESEKRAPEIENRDSENENRKSSLRSSGSGHRVETVFIPDGDRATLCVSCQVGCKMNCLFCQTGKQGWQGNLTAADILNQVFALPESERLTNIVFMGQGEPMDNLNAVLRATEVLTAPWGLAWSPKRITVSSVGIKTKLKQFLDECECHVAISLHTPIHEQRQQLMPAEKAMPIAEIVELLKQYDFSHQRRLSFEYTVFKGVNDSMAHAKEILRLLKGLDCRINLIRFHQIPDVDLQGTDMKSMENLRDYLTNHGIFTTIRASRGEDIYAACGLLNTMKK